MKEFKEIASDLQNFTEGIANAEQGNVEYDDIVSMLENIVRIFSGCQAQAQDLIELHPENFSSTDAAIVIAALMQAQDLNTFDIGLWLAKQNTH